MKLKAIVSALLAFGLTTGLAGDAAARQGKRSKPKTQSGRKATKRNSAPRTTPGDASTTIAPVQPQTGDPQVTMPLLPEKQRNKPRVRIVPAPPPGTVPQPPVPPKTEGAER